MIAVIFEVVPNDGHAQDYFDIAAALKPQIADIDGFLSIERFQSLADPGRYLSLSFWRDEAAVAQWRNTSEHRAAQAAGRAGILSDYRLRIAEVTRDYGRLDRTQAPADSRATHG
ncbi:MAG: antibiotic biosynthesis monooxygenase [Hyphomonas sp.]|nr:antibiotic biosynthesis monooxygenase [Hyphomonas sp.]